MHLYDESQYYSVLKSCHSASLQFVCIANIRPTIKYSHVSDTLSKHIDAVGVRSGNFCGCKIYFAQNYAANFLPTIFCSCWYISFFTKP